MGSPSLTSRSPPSLGSLSAACCCLALATSFNYSLFSFQNSGTLSLAWEPGGEGQAIWWCVHCLPHSWHREVPLGRRRIWGQLSAFLLLYSLPAGIPLVTTRAKEEMSPRDICSYLKGTTRLPSTEVVLRSVPLSLREVFLLSPASSLALSIFCEMPMGWSHEVN